MVEEIIGARLQVEIESSKGRVHQALQALNFGDASLEQAYLDGLMEAREIMLSTK